MFLGSDFISVTKGEAEWPHIRPAILGAIMEHYMSGAPVVGDAAADEGTEEQYDPEDEETVRTIKELLDTRVRPAVANDGGDITFQGFRDGVVYLHMRGACSGCPSCHGDAAARRGPARALLPDQGAAGSRRTTLPTRRSTATRSAASGFVSAGRTVRP